MTSSQKIPKTLIYILILLFLAVVLLFVIFLKNKSKNSSTTTTPTPVQEIKWETYTDANYKYSITYPPSLVLKNESENSIILDKSETIVWRENMAKKDAKIKVPPFINIIVYRSLSEIDSNDKCEETTINNNQTFSCTTSTLNKYFYIPKGVFVYKINFDDKSSSPELQKQIINSIKFE